MNIKQMYEELEKLGGFITDYEQLNQKQIDFLENNNKFGIDIEELLEIINDFHKSNLYEISYVYEDVEDLARQELDNGYDIPIFLEWYIDYEGLGNAIVNDYEGYVRLKDNRIAYID